MEKKENQKEKKNDEKMDLSMRVFFAFILLFRFVFCLLLFFFFPVKKQNTCKIKAKKQIKKNK